MPNRAVFSILIKGINAGGILSTVGKAMGELPIEISAVVLDADPRAATIQCSGRLTIGMNYLIEGHDVNFLAGKVLWVRAGLAGLFFQNTLHPDTLERLRSSRTQSAAITLRPLA